MDRPPTASDNRERDSEDPEQSREQCSRLRTPMPIPAPEDCTTGSPRALVEFRSVRIVSQPHL
jgi:hypothetical protein